MGARSARREAVIQSLWSGYGELLRIRLEGGRAPTAIAKWVRPPADAIERKLRSYEVETEFYRSVAPRSPLRVPAFYGARVGTATSAGRLHGERDESVCSGAPHGERLLLLEDLDAAGFGRRTDEAHGADLDAMLAWLARFHAQFLGERVAGVWPIGTYWQLETRRDELAAIDDRELRDAASALTARLTSARFQTLLHGDAKDANFCFSANHDVAAVDFQYTGHGPGIVDVAYLLYGRSDEPDDGIDSARLDSYFRHLARPDVEAEWRALYPIALARFLPIPRRLATRTVAPR